MILPELIVFVALCFPFLRVLLAVASDAQDGGENEEDAEDDGDEGDYDGRARFAVAVSSWWLTRSAWCQAAALRISSSLVT